VLRWRTVEDDPQGTLFADEDLVERHVGRGQFRGLEFFHVRARTVINRVPAASRMPFSHTINAYRGCSHACVYCILGDTPVLMRDGTARPIRQLRPGEEIVGTERRGASRRFVPSTVLDRFESLRPAYRVTLADGTELVASADHRFLTGRGWKHVTGTEQGHQRPHLTVNDELLGTGSFATSAPVDDDYRRGYLCGMVRRDGRVGYDGYSSRPRRDVVHGFRLTLTDVEALDRSRDYLARHGVATSEYVFQDATETRRATRAIRTRAADSVATIESLISWPDAPSPGWRRGFLAGVFDAEGSYRRGILRISNKDERILAEISQSLATLGLRSVIEPARPNGVRGVRLVGGIGEQLRFFHTVDPAITRKRSVLGHAIKNAADLRVRAVEPLGVELPMYDLTTTTADFIANGVVSHNCFARPTHDYLGFGIGEDFDRKIVVKVNAVERVRAELASPRWGGHAIAMGTNTDPYQRAEGKYHLTRGIISALADAANPFSILTKSTLILRDLDLLVEAAARTQVRTNFSIGTLDPEVWRRTEPGTPHPRQRIEAVARLNAAGIPCGVLVAPVLPGLSDHDDQLAEVADACVAAGATSISAMYLHLRPGVREHWFEWMNQALPDRVAEYEARYAGRAYLAARHQKELGARMDRMVAAARRRRQRR
jgi:DNA repair photolyase